MHICMHIIIMLIKYISTYANGMKSDVLVIKQWGFIDT